MRPFQETASGLWQVSSAGGAHPVFGPDGTELFFRAPDSPLMRAPVDTRGPTWSAGRPVQLLAGRYAPIALTRDDDIALDGQRFLMLKA